MFRFDEDKISVLDYYYHYLDQVEPILNLRVYSLEMQICCPL